MSNPRTAHTRDVTWRLATFAALSTAELYELMRLRQLVFVVEQACAYLDADGRDPEALHLLGWRVVDGERRELLACARLFAPGTKHAEAVIGRVVTHPAVRGQGLGRELMLEAIAAVERSFATTTIRLSAQRYLEQFYASLGFVAEGEPYDEDGIPHIEMVRR
ncbi:MAG TPA: GNAT family N-acetyltransferase [Candidatus Kapabacteria bacterium]|jgi:ElaA protein|nr:GNAT family N-acetyltransferase [Candidatus Kapabacteria bacterium]